MAEKLVMRLGEERIYDMDFSLFPEMVAGQTIAAVESVTAVPPEGLTLTGPTNSSKHAQVTIESTAQGEYHVIYTVTTNTGSRLIADGRLKVIGD